MNENNNVFLDGTKIDSWFYEIKSSKIEDFKSKYLVTDFGIYPDGNLYTKEIQSLIDKISKEGGGLLCFPKGTFLTGALFFKQGVHLYLCKDSILKGSNHITDYPLCKTRIEGETCTYFPALINIDHVNGTILFGSGTIDGNGLESWKSYWIRFSWNPLCTNKDEQRARLLYISNSSNIKIEGLKLENAQFWTTHLYKSDHIKVLNCQFYSPFEPVKAPSTDAIDIDVCEDILIKNCYIHVNDDGIVLKGGKGPYADKMIENGSNERIIVEDCNYGYSHGCLTCGSESIHNRNIIVRRIKVKYSKNLIWLKMRPDTPQLYEYIQMEDVEGSFENMINITPWTQFYDLKDCKTIPLSFSENILIRNCNCKVLTYFKVQKCDEQYKLSNFTFENFNVIAKEYGEKESNCINQMISKNVKITIIP